MRSHASLEESDTNTVGRGRVYHPKLSRSRSSAARRGPSRVLTPNFGRAHVQKAPASDSAATVSMAQQPTAARVTEALAAIILIQRWMRSVHAAAGVNGTGIVVSSAERSVGNVERVNADTARILVATAATAQPGAVPRGKPRNAAATVAATAAVIATAVAPADASWLEDGCAALVARAASGRSEKSAAQRAKDSDEARARSAALSTKADTTGVQFRGREFQRLYLESKYVRRASLIYQLLGTVLEASGPSAAKELFTAQLTAAGSGKQRLEVCSVGGGPGTDAAGVVVANQRWLGFRAGGARSTGPS